jgi:hypothetical protein
MRPWKEFKKDRRIHRQVSTHTKTPQSCESRDGSEVRRSSCNHPKYTRHAESKVKSPFSTKDVAAKAPENGPSEEPNVLCEGQQRRARGRELICDGCNCDLLRPVQRAHSQFRNGIAVRLTNQGGDDGPHIVIGPAKADDNEQLPLIPAHTDLLYLSL